MKDQIRNAKTNNYATEEQFQRILAEQLASLHLRGFVLTHDLRHCLSARYFGLSAVCDRVVNRSSGDLFIHHGSDCGSSFQSKLTSNPSIREPETGTPRGICNEHLLSRLVPVIRLRRQDDPLAFSLVKPGNVTPQAHYGHDSKRESGE